MEKNLLIIALASFFVVSCSSTNKTNSISMATASSGIVKNHHAPFTLFLTDKIEARQDIEKKAGNNVVIIHTGHILQAGATKADNEKILASLADKGMDAVNLTIEDFIIADKQQIMLENFPQLFLNSSVVDLNEDNIIAKKNIRPYLIQGNMALIGISDKNIDGRLSVEKFLVSDYVLAILRAKKAALKESQEASSSKDNIVDSFIIIHTIGDEINAVMDRLPPNFINSKAD